MSNWHYKKKYLLNITMIFPFLISGFFIIVGLLLLFNDGLMPAAMILLFGGFPLIALILPIFINKYIEKDLTLIEFKQLAVNVYNCIFYDAEQQKAIHFLYSSNPCYQLEENRKYIVVLETKKRTIMEIIKPLGMSDTTFIGAQQKAVEELKKEKPYITFDYVDTDKNNLSLESETQVIKEEEIPVTNKKTALFIDTLSCIIYSGVSAVGAWLMYLSLVGRSDPPTFGFFMGLPFFLLPFIKIIKTIKKY